MAAQARRVWDRQLLRNPHEASDKRARVQRMFAAIAPSYDLNNRLHSLWQDQQWRKRAVELARLKPADVVVDVACGTGDLAMKFADAGAARVVGVDFTFEMLRVAGQKQQIGAEASEVERGRVGASGGQPGITFINGDALSLPLADACCDVVSIAFGIRNVQDPARALAEFRRVLRPGGRLIVLEFSLPTNRLLRSLYNFYFRRVLPLTATLISGDKTGAYKYLPESVNTFIGRSQMLQMMERAGFSSAEAHPLTFGVCVCYRGVVRG